MATVRPIDLQDAPDSLLVHQENDITMFVPLVINIKLIYLRIYHYYKISSKNV